jgi:ParB family chromosome partitioning protein
MMGKQGRYPESLTELDPALILPNPAQPRKSFGEGEMEQLADSVRRWGILQPLTVRARTEDGKTVYELISGERRMRAAIMAGLRSVPCRIINTDGKSSAEMAIVENLQRKDLDPFEEADAIRVLLELYGMTQEGLAERLSVSQSYIANKLRLLRLTEEEQQKILGAQLTERHARALLRLGDTPERAAALSVIIARAYNVAQTEAYIERLLEQKRAEEPHKRKIKGAIGDLRLFYNSLDRALGIMRGAGMRTNCRKRMTDEGVEVTLVIRRKEE